MLGEKHQHQHFTRNQIRAGRWAGTLISVVASESGWEEIYICIRSIWIQEEFRCLVNFHILSVLSPRPYKTRQLKCSWHLAGSASTPHRKGWGAHPGGTPHGEAGKGQRGVGGHEETELGWGRDRSVTPSQRPQGGLSLGRNQSPEHRNAHPQKRKPGSQEAWRMSCLLPAFSWTQTNSRLCGM